MNDDYRENCVLRAMAERRSMARVRPERPPQELLQQIIAAASWAPNHFKTEPWRFVVVAGDARSALGKVMEESFRAARSRTQAATRQQDDDTEARAEKERSKPLRAPVVIAVAALPPSDPKAVPQEELAAVAAATQNMLLAAEALGLGAMWRTGKPAYDPLVKHFLGLPTEAEIVAFLYIGYPDLPPQPRRERTAERYVRWLG